MSFAPQRHALFRHPNLQKWSEPLVFLTFWLRNVLRATTAYTFSTSQLPEVVHLVCFAHFDLEMCFAPQRRALFRHLNFQKWSDHGVFCTFWLRNVLRATTACNFSSLISRTAVCHSSGCRLYAIAIVDTISRICIFFLLTLSLLLFFLLIFLFSLPLPCSAFHLSILSEVWLLNFLRSYHIIPYQIHIKSIFWDEHSLTSSLAAQVGQWIQWIHLLSSTWRGRSPGTEPWSLVAWSRGTHRGPRMPSYWKWPWMGWFTYEKWWKMVDLSIVFM